MAARNLRPANAPTTDVMPWEADRPWARPVCHTCGASTRRPAPLSERGHLDLYHLPEGWSCAPFPAGYTHAFDGSTGTLYTCPRCSKKDRLQWKRDRW